MGNLFLKIFVKNHTDTTNEKVRQGVGTLSSIIGIVLNILLAAAKIVVGILSGVLSILADGINNLSDCGNNVVALVGIRLANKPADKDHPFGHRRIEYVASLVVGIVVIIAAIELMVEGIGNIISPEESKFSWWTIGVLSLSIIVKLWMSFFNKANGKKYNLELLLATATDSIMDVCATAGVLVSVLITKWTGFVYLDGIVSVVVALLICFGGYSVIKQTLNHILGEAPDTKLVKQIYDRIRCYDGVVGIHDLNVHNYGPGKYYASVHVEVDRNVDVMVSHELVDTIERDFAENTNITLVIHMDPVVVGDPELDMYKEKITEIVAKIDTNFGVHDFRMVKGPERINLIFDVGIPYDSKLSATEIAQVIQFEIAKLYKNVYVVPTIEAQSCEDIMEEQLK